MRTRSSTMVGRGDELRTLEQALSAARGGRGGAVFLLGEGGIGKSRLAAAAADLAFATDMCLLRGRASTIGPIVPFRSLTEALMSLVRSGDAIDIAELGPYRPVLGRLIPDWGQPDEAGGDGGSLVVLGEAVLRLTGLAGRGRGCLLVLDDLQDADAETLAVVEYLIDNLDRQPTVLLCTVRTEPCSALDLARSAAQRGAGVAIELDRLGRDDLRVLAASCLGCTPEDVPAAVAERLWSDSAGHPLLAEELLNGYVGGGLLVRGADGWRVTGELQTNVPATLTRSVARRLDQLDPQGRELLSVAAVVGRRFPLTVVQAVTGLDDRSLLSHLHGDVAAQLVAPDEQTPDWYAFQHPLIVEALLTLLAPVERARLARRAADAAEDIFPGLPGEWCQISAALRLAAGDAPAAGRLFAEAGHRALAQGAAASAVTLLDRARELLAGDPDVAVRAGALEAFLYALAEAGLVERALGTVSALDQVGGGLDRTRRAQLHTRLAWVAAVAGRSADGLAHVESARALLGPDAAPEETAPIDVVAAHLALDVPGSDQLERAESMARRAATVAEAAPLPVVACQAWQLLGALTRRRDLDEATECLERSRAIAVQHRLPIWEIHALVRLGNDDALRDGSLDRLEQARQEALRVGAVTATYQAESNIALLAVLRGDFETAATINDKVLAAVARLKLLETAQFALLTRAILAGHQGRRRDLDSALSEFRRWGGDQDLHGTRIHGLARAFCALLEENRSRALDDLTQVHIAEQENPSFFHLHGRYGLRLLLRALTGAADWAEYEATAAEPAARLRWNWQFVLLTRAVLAGRAGRAAEATDAVAEALQTAAPYAMARHLGLRLVAEAALTDGWGTPIEWLRTAEEYFHGASVAPVASACRALLRRAGITVTRRREGAEDIPTVFRSAGVTVREYEVLQLLIDRLGNREIADRLHLSARTVEKHVASLITKTGQPDRIALSEFAATIVRG